MQIRGKPGCEAERAQLGEVSTCQTHAIDSRFRC
jgi:hypothetical protein